jgi:hypothetical protein
MSDAKDLKSYDPAVRVRAGQDLVRAGLTDNSKPLLAHVENELDDRVVAAIAHAVMASPQEGHEPRRVVKLRAWAEGELKRLELEDRFLGLEPDPIERPAELAERPADAAAPSYISWRPPG